MTSKITLKKSSVPGKVPLVTDLEYGELAINYADGVLYYKTSNNTINNLGQGSTSLSTTSTDPVVLVEFSSILYGSAELLIQATNSTRHLTKVLVISDSLGAIHTEFGTLVTSTPIFSLAVSNVSDSIRITVTPTTSSPTTFQARYTLMKG